jgi:hypothetical protein
LRLKPKIGTKNMRAKDEDIVVVFILIALSFWKENILGRSSTMRDELRRSGSSLC